MKLYRFLTLLTLVTVSLACIAFAQAPTITTIGVKDTGCFYKVGSKPCSIGPGMTVNINGSNFGKVPGGVTLCDCPPATIITWYSNRVTVVVNSVTPSASLYLETLGGSFSNTIPYSPLGPVITSIVVDNCTYVPNQSSNLCKITPGTQFTINGSYFGPSTDGGIAVTCTDCGGDLRPSTVGIRIGSRAHRLTTTRSWLRRRRPSVVPRSPFSSTPCGATTFLIPPVDASPTLARASRKSGSSLSGRGYSRS